MAISIRNPKVEELAREIAEKEHLSMTEVILLALEDRKREIGKVQADEQLRFKTLKAIAEHCSSLPDLDSRSVDEILGYDDMGISL